MSGSKQLDAETIVDKTIVQEIEKELSFEMLEKSQIEELVIRAEQEVEKSDEKVEEKSEEKPIQKDDGEMEDEEWKPLDGATSIGDAQKFLEAVDLTEKLYKAFGILGAVTQNIMEDEEMPIDQKITALNKAVTDFKGILSPDKLKELSMNDGLNELKEMIKNLADKVAAIENRAASEPVEEPKVEEKSEILEISQDFDMKLKSILELPKVERKAGLQNLLGAIGESFAAIENEISKSEKQPEVDIENIVAKTVDAKMSGISAQLEALTNLVKTQKAQLSNLRTPIENVPVNFPVQKSIQNLPPVTNVKQVSGLSIRDIVRKTTVG